MHAKFIAPSESHARLDPENSPRRFSDKQQQINRCFSRFAIKIQAMAEAPGDNGAACGCSLLRAHPGCQGHPLPRDTQRALGHFPELFYWVAPVKHLQNKTSTGFVRGHSSPRVQRALLGLAQPCVDQSPGFPAKASTPSAILSAAHSPSALWPVN